MEVVGICNNFVISGKWQLIQIVFRQFPEFSIDTRIIYLLACRDI